jgi:hypothetical protein
MLFELLTTDIPELFPFMETVLQDGGLKKHQIETEMSRSCYVDGRSGYHYHGANLEASLEFGVLLGGSGYVIRRYLKSETENWERYDHFTPQGAFTYSSTQKSLDSLYVDTLDMDVTCPILNHFYNFLSCEYKQAAEGKSWATIQVHAVEKFLRRVYKLNNIHIPIQDGVKDPAIANIYQKILKAELDPVLTWEERQLVFENYRETLAKIIATKVRAHKISKINLNLKLLKKGITNFAKRVAARPFSNARGLLHRYTIGKILWFYYTVKDNLGYSVALAVYGPFTYYFITMPMNPHAMQAVGTVRGAYLDAKSEISLLIDRATDPAKISTTAPPALAQPIIANAEADVLEAQREPEAKILEDSVSTQNAAPVVDQKLLANIIYESNTAMGPVQEISVDLGEGVKEKFKPTFLNMLLTTDIPKVDRQTWNERMSNFKQMQIGYEENIEYASRMGRLEQLETQYNFPMQIESTWEELERYNNLIFKLREENPNLSPKMKQYLTNEVNRTQQLELYLWDRMGRFVLDQIYVMLDQDKEQKRNDYYVGRSFVFMQEMTNILSWRYKNFKKPEGYDKIEKLAGFYAKNRKEYGSVMNNLKANSDLFKQKDLLNTKEFRGYMKRQWEILFLQNSKAEEASNNGLNMYIWSVRNTAWVLQSLYSAKREELGLLIKRDSTGTMFSPGDQLNSTKVSMMYEIHIHNLTLEYVGIREEIMNRLGKDIESTQRMMVLDNLKEFLTDREKLDGMNMAKTQKTAENTL